MHQTLVQRDLIYGRGDFSETCAGEKSEVEQSLPHEISRRFRAVVVSDAFRKSLIAKNLAPYRIGKSPHRQNRVKIHQKYRKSYFFCIFDVFWPYFEGCCVSYPVGGQVFPKSLM